MGFLANSVRRLMSPVRIPGRPSAKKPELRKSSRKTAGSVTVWQWLDQTCSARTKSEARAEFKRRENLKRLPVGAVVTRLMLALILLGITAGHSLAVSRKPVLEVWTSSTCGPCLEFWRDYEREATLRRTLDASFRVVKKEYRDNPVEGKLKMIRVLPTFLIGCRRFEGYRGPDDLLKRLRRKPIPAKPHDPAKGDPMNPPATQSTSPTRRTDEDLAAELAAIRSELAELKAAAADNTALTAREREIIIVEGKTGPQGPAGPPGVAPDQLSEIIDRLDGLAALEAENRAAAMERADMAAETDRWAAEFGRLTAELKKRLDHHAEGVADLLDVVEEQKGRIGEIASKLTVTAEQAAAARVENHRLQRRLTICQELVSQAREETENHESRLQFAEQRIARLEQFARSHRVTVQILDQSGNVIREQSFNINEPIQFRLTPYRPEKPKTE